MHGENVEASHNSQKQESIQIVEKPHGEPSEPVVMHLAELYRAEQTQNRKYSTVRN